jgi:hypothetical protein
VLSTDSAVNIRLARDGLGLTIVYEDQVRDEIARGELAPVLEAFCEPFAGYYLYYPQRRHASPALRALIDHLRGAREAAGAGSRAGGGPPRGSRLGAPRVRAGAELGVVAGGKPARRSRKTAKCLPP